MATSGQLDNQSSVHSRRRLDGLPRRIEWGAAIVASPLSAPLASRVAASPAPLLPAPGAHVQQPYEPLRVNVPRDWAPVRIQYSALSTDRYPGPMQCAPPPPAFPASTRALSLLSSLASSLPVPCLPVLPHSPRQSAVVSAMLALASRLSPSLYHYPGKSAPTAGSATEAEGALAASFKLGTHTHLGLPPARSEKRGGAARNASVQCVHVFSATCRLPLAVCAPCTWDSERGHMSIRMMAGTALNDLSRVASLASLWFLKVQVVLVYCPHRAPRF